MSIPTYFPFVVLLALIGTAAILYLLLHSGLAARLALDKPNHRSLHSLPTPRVGGLAMLASIMAAWLLSPNADLLLIGLSCALLALSFADDRYGLPIGLRLAVHFGIALTFILFHTTMAAPWLIVVFAVAIVWLINLYNFMDGADGLAGGMALFGFGSYGMAAVFGGDWLMATKCFCIAAAALGFLLFNFPPAKVFMGDAGSIPLGFLAGALGLEGWNHNLWHYWFPILVFSPFALDATVTLLKRVARREPFWRAHQEHYYQRMIRMGSSHRVVAIVEYSLMGAAAISAMYGNGQPATGQPIAIQHTVVGVWLVLYVGLMLAVDHRWRHFVSEKA